MHGLSATKMAVVERWPLRRGGYCREVAIVERFKQECMYGLSAKKWPL